MGWERRGAELGAVRGGVPIKIIHCPDLYFHKQKAIISSGHRRQICHWYQQHTTCGKFAIGVRDFRISPQIFKNIQNDPSIIFRGLGEDYYWGLSNALKIFD
jgi:hypothetical protein